MGNRQYPLYAFIKASKPKYRFLAHYKELTIFKNSLPGFRTGEFVNYFKYTMDMIA